MRLVSEFRRRNVLRMAALYVVAAWLLVQVAGVLIDLAKLPDWTGTITLWMLAVGFPIALIFSWFYEITPEGISLEKDVDPTVSITHVTGRRLDFIVISMLCAAVILFAYDKWWTSDPPDRSVAVLPFVNLSGNPDNDYLSDGITETLLHGLAQLPDLKVPARTSSFFFKGQDIDVREIAEQLGVSNILEGSIQRAGNKLRVVAQLIEAETGFHLWSETYDRDMSDIFAVQDDIANSVAAAMKITLSDDIGKGGIKIEPVGTQSVTAYEIYLEGLQQKNLESNKPLLLAAVSFMEALAVDNDFYAARLELAKTYWLQSGVGEITRAEARAYIEPLIVRMRGDRPDDIYVQILEANVQGLRSIDIEALLVALTVAIERMPNEAELYRVKGSVLGFLKRPAEAIELLNRGIAVDPFGWKLHYSLAQRLMAVGDLDGAEVEYAKAIELNPKNPTVYTHAANVHWERGEFAKAIAFEMQSMQADPLDNDIPAGIAEILYIYGLIDEGDKYLQRALLIAPDRAYVRVVKLLRLLLLDDYSKARDMSESLLREDIEDRFGVYRFAAMVFASTMAESGGSEKALAVMEELRPGVSSADFVPRNRKEQWLQYAAVLAAAQSRSQEETQRMLDAIVPRWDNFYPDWRDYGSRVAVIEMARGNSELAVEITLDLLKGTISRNYLIYLHINSFKGLAQEPPVAARIDELGVEAKKGGEKIWAYIVEHELQL